MKKIKRVSVYLWAVLLIIVDQVIKFMVTNNMKGKSITIIKGILKFTYCENKGVAFSFGDGHVPIFIIINLFIICGLMLYFEKNRKKFRPIISKIFFTMVIAGGIGNLIDRITKGFVIDFIDISDLFNFAIFNVADIFIVVGIIGLALYFSYLNIRSTKK